MTTTDSNLNQLIINEMTQAEYDTITANQNELYVITDGVMQSSDVINALGYTPYNGTTNPNNYTSNIGTVTSVNGAQPDSNGNVSISIPSITNLADKDLSNLSSTGEAKFQAPISDLATIRSNASNGQTAYENMDGSWTSVSASYSQVVSSVSLNYSSNYSISLASILPTNDTYEIIVTGKVTTGTTSGNYAQVRLSVTGFPASVLLCMCRTRTNSSVEAEGTATILYTKGTSTLSLERSTNSNLKGTADLWVLAYRKVR